MVTARGRWTEQVLRLVGDAALRRRLGEAAREVVLAEHTIALALPRLGRPADAGEAAQGGAALVQADVDVVVAGVVAVAGDLLRLAAAAAGRAWCRTAPVIAVDGRVANVFVSGPDGARALVTGPVMVVVTVPAGAKKDAAATEGRRTAASRQRVRQDADSGSGATTELLAVDQGFGHGYAVEFRASPKLTRTARRARVEAAFNVPAAEAMLVLLEWQPGHVGRVTVRRAGAANGWVALRTVV